MVGFAHVILHVALCNAVAKAAPETTVAMRVSLSFRVGAPQFDQVYKFQRGTGPEAVVEFDIARGEYRLRLDVPKYNCSGTDLLDFLSDHNRDITEALSDTSAPSVEPLMLLEGAAPMSFRYVRPTFVLLDGSLTCNQPVGTPLASPIDVENDGDAYYVRLHLDPSFLTHKPVLSLRLRTTTGLYHYIRVSVPFPLVWRGWPDNLQFDVTEDALDSLATEKTDTLLCPKLFRSSVSGEPMPH
jgi:hypothetical protein